jgi:predicted ATPase
MYMSEFLVKNYLSHRNTRVQLFPITVFVGPNAGGKSALFDAILNFSIAARGNIRQAFGPYPFSYAATKHHAAMRFENIAFEVTLAQSVEDQEKLQYSIDYHQENSSDSSIPVFGITSELLKTVPGEQVIFDRRNASCTPLKRALQFVERDRSIFAALRTAYTIDRTVPPSEARFSEIARAISRFNRFRLNPYVLASVSKSPDLSRTEFAPRIGYEGEDLAACLYYLQETKSGTLEAINAKIRRLEPNFDGFNFNFFGTDKIGFSISFTDARGDVPAVRISSGLLLYIGLMVLTYGPDRPPVMLIEEPENGLTPKAAAEFYSAVRELALKPDQNQRSQILISSHSPFVICNAWNGDDRDFVYQVKVVNGESVVRKFSQAIEEGGAILQKPKAGEPAAIGLRTAEEVMSGRFA